MPPNEAYYPSMVYNNANDMFTDYLFMSTVMQNAPYTFKFESVNKSYAIENNITCYSSSASLIMAANSIVLLGMLSL